MHKNPENSDKQRQCHRCKSLYPATPEHFLRDKTRPLGIAYECRGCHRLRKAGRDNRADRWANHTPEQRQKAIARRRKYGRTDKGRAVFLRKAYERIDACDMTTAEVYELIRQPCVHCGTTELPRGLDRIDNSRAHTKDNVAPACAPCNFARGDRFTFEEMKLIGAVIRKIISDRPTTAAGSVGHLETRLSNLHPIR